MSQGRPVPDEFWPLLDAACDDELSAEQREALEKHLDENSDARRAFLDHIWLRTQIRLCRKGQRACEAGLAKIEALWGEERPIGDDERDSPIFVDHHCATAPAKIGTVPFSSPTSIPIPPIVLQPVPAVQPSVFSLNAPLGGMLFSYAVSALFVCLGMLIGWMWKVSEPDLLVRGDSPVPRASVLSPSPKMVFVGRITGMVDCTFSSDRDILPPPSSFAHVPLGRKYKLDSGLMEITYDTGAKVILQGPMTFDVESAYGGFLSVGKLTARVGERGEGRGERVYKNTNWQSSTSDQLSPSPLSSLPSPLFFVRTPTAVVTDLGTEFGVECDKSGTTFSHVFRGSVRMQLTESAEASGQGEVLDENESARVEKTNGEPLTIRRTREKSAGYVRVLPPPKRVTESAAYSELVLSLHPAVYYRMEHPKNEQDKLRVFDSAPGACSGELYLANEFGQPWVPGRFGDSLFFRGTEVGDHVIVPDYPKAQNDQLTVSAWVMAESRPFFAMIVANWGGSAHPEPNITGQFHFGLYGQEGDLSVQVTQHDGKCMTIREGVLQPLPIGVWQHVAFVADGKILRLYRNGVEVASAPSEGILPQPPMRSLAIGCKTNDTGKEVSPNIPAYWQGRIDELAIFNAALSAETIRMLSETPKKEALSSKPKQGK